MNTYQLIEELILMLQKMFQLLHKGRKEQKTCDYKSPLNFQSMVNDDHIAELIDVTIHNDVLFKASLIYILNNKSMDILISLIIQYCRIQLIIFKDSI